uniref:Uncharacterized protein n=1 Tax=Picea glauca TaxID=3330 RepID=A0A101M393_PICGL|nr:hypothetical protein ABT39_MTgene3310 [Picea glauca]QHR88585.1 hypothetical protein Q903MT_gene2599 [Picea sitchensis]
MCDQSSKGSEINKGVAPVSGCSSIGLPIVLQLDDFTCVLPHSIQTCKYLKPQVLTEILSTHSTSPREKLGACGRTLTKDVSHFTQV